MSIDPISQGRSVHSRGDDNPVSEAHSHRDTAQGEIISDTLESMQNRLQGINLPTGTTEPPEVSSFLTSVGGLVTNLQGMDPETLADTSGLLPTLKALSGVITPIANQILQQFDSSTGTVSFDDPLPVLINRANNLITEINQQIMS